MINPQTLFEVMNAKQTFEENHPRFIHFLEDMCKGMLREGSILEIRICQPDGEEISGNMLVKASDMEMIEKLRQLKP